MVYLGQRNNFYEKQDLGIPCVAVCYDIHALLIIFDLYLVHLTTKIMFKKN